MSVPLRDQLDGEAHHARLAGRQVHQVAADQSAPAGRGFAKDLAPQTTFTNQRQVYLSYVCILDPVSFIEAVGVGVEGDVSVTVGGKAVPIQQISAHKPEIEFLVLGRRRHQKRLQLPSA